MRNKFLGTGEPGFRPIRKAMIVFSGLRYAIFYDFSVAYKVILSLAALLLAYVFRAWVDSLVIFMATSSMMVAEIFNTAIEAICDYLQTDEDEKIKAIKDMAAAATGLTIVVWYGVLGYEGYEVWLLFRGG